MKLNKQSALGLIDFSENPRDAKNFNKANPGIIELSKSLQNHGQMVPIILYEAPWISGYGVLDGLRRLVAVFEVLGWDEIEANVISIKTPMELKYKQLIVNIDRKEFNPVEKGKSIFYILKMEMEKDGLDIDKNWTNREVKGEYLNRVSTELNKSKSTISRYVNLFMEIPKEDRAFIASNREDLKDGMISSNKAYQVLTIGRSLNRVKETFREYYPSQEKRKKNPPVVTTKEIKVMKRAISEGQVTDLAGLKKLRGSEQEWNTMSILVTREEEKIVAILSSRLKVNSDKVWRGAIRLAEKHMDELKKEVSKI